MWRERSSKQEVSIVVCGKTNDVPAEGPPRPASPWSSANMWCRPVVKTTRRTVSSHPAQTQDPSRPNPQQRPSKKGRRGPRRGRKFRGGACGLCAVCALEGAGSRKAALARAAAKSLPSVQKCAVNQVCVCFSQPPSPWGPGWPALGGAKSMHLLWGGARARGAQAALTECSSC